MHMLTEEAWLRAWGTLLVLACEFAIYLNFQFSRNLAISPAQPLTTTRGHCASRIKQLIYWATRRDRFEDGQLPNGKLRMQPRTAS